MKNPTAKDLPIFWQILVVTALVTALVVFAHFRMPLLGSGIFLSAVIASWIKGLTMRPKRN